MGAAESLAIFEGIWFAMLGGGFSTILALLFPCYMVSLIVRVARTFVLNLILPSVMCICNIVPRPARLTLSGCVVSSVGVRSMHRFAIFVVVWLPRQRLLDDSQGAAGIHLGHGRVATVLKLGPPSTLPLLSNLFQCIPAPL